MFSFSIVLGFDFRSERLYHDCIYQNQQSRGDWIIISKYAIDFSYLSSVTILWSSIIDLYDLLCRSCMQGRQTKMLSRGARIRERVVDLFLPKVKFILKFSLLLFSCYIVTKFSVLKYICVPEKLCFLDCVNLTLIVMLVSFN